MKIPATQLTRQLDRWLRQSHDDHEPELVVRQAGPDIIVTRHDGSDLTTSEHIEVLARVAAHRVRG